MIFNLSDSNLYILKDIILQLDLFTLSVHLFTDNKLLITCISFLAI